jgi:hypothetical protein
MSAPQEESFNDMITKVMAKAQGLGVPHANDDAAAAHPAQPVASPTKPDARPSQPAGLEQRKSTTPPVTSDSDKIQSVSAPMTFQPVKNRVTLMMIAEWLNP